MELSIKQNDALRRKVNEAEIIWKLYFKKVLKAIVIQIAVGILFLVYGFSHETGHDQLATEVYPNIFVGQFGIAYLILVFGRFFTHNRQKRKYLDEVARVARLSFGQKNESLIFIGEESVITETPLAKTETQWPLFSFYSFYDHYLLLHLSAFSFNMVVIDKELVSTGQFEELVNFVKIKIPEKKKALW